MINKKIKIQEEISVKQGYIDEVIKHYEEMSPNLFICMGDFSGNRDDIIREIKNLSNIGKRILLMDYNFRQSDFYKNNLKEFNK